MRKRSNIVSFSRDRSSRRDGESLLASSAFLNDLYEKWKDDPESVSAEWSGFFEGFEFGVESSTVETATDSEFQSRVASLISAYRNQGHQAACIDPLGESPAQHPSLGLDSFGLKDSDLERTVDPGNLVGIGKTTLGEILEILRDTYCGTVAVEYRHIQAAGIRHWLEEQMEPVRNTPSFNRSKEIEILRQLIDASVFENFLHSRYPGQKRFSLEGSESVIPALHFLVEMSPEVGADNIIMGMAHRGRLNVLANILGKPYAAIFSEFEDIRPATVGGDGDVKYHLGYSSRIKTRSGKTVHLSLTANPSHLEAVDPVVEGRARARQRRLNDTQERTRVLPVLVHGDAAFAGQGLVAETLNLSQLAGYKTGGTIHFIINNQIGFTTTPEEARSTTHPTDVAKMIEAPIFHVNGDDPDAVVYVVELALRFRQKFKRDVVVDIVCYRRHGHNEGDEPAFTQPLLYKKIKDRPPIHNLYTEELVRRGHLSEKQVQKISNAFKGRLERAFESVKKTAPPADQLPLESYWEGLNHPYSHTAVETAVTHESLLEVGEALTTIPSHFNLNSKVARHLPEAFTSIQNQESVPWALAELLAFGTLLSEGIPVRLSGQDSQRGTFSQRHAVWTDMESQEDYVPLNHIREEQARFCVYNSMLSEAAVLGFDYGYSISEPQMLVLWEAQFGDFANGAQVIIDQFVVASQAKWNQSSGLVLLLPHGYEGQGPEHSNAYLERYLAACAEENIQVCNLSTPAQYFHVLRRQLKRDFRRPLVIMAPKSLLRHPRAVSPISELTSGHFQEIIDDSVEPGEVKRLVLCSGKVFYELDALREEKKPAGVAIVRVEQFYPFHWEQIKNIADRYKGVEKIIWAQEEPKNRGAWSFLYPGLIRLFGFDRVDFAGRPASASPAIGSLNAHKREQAKLLHLALGLPLPDDERKAKDN